MKMVEIKKGFFLHSCRIIGTEIVTLSVWEKTDIGSSAGHSTITSDEGKGWLGNVKTRRLPARLDNIPSGKVRLHKVLHYQRRLAQLEAAALRIAAKAA